MPDQQPYRTVDKFDRMIGALDKLPDVTKSAPSTVRAVVPMIGESQTFIIQTFRQRERATPSSSSTSTPKRA